MREIVIISGKGGTGKTSIAGSLAALARDAVIADCDVDAANLSLILRPTIKETHVFTGSRRAVVDPERCTGCGFCADVCRLGAITVHPATGVGSRPVAVVDRLSCEGCGVCRHVCPSGAVDLKRVSSGRWFVSDTPHGPLVHARLKPGEENSGKLVAVVRQEARKTAEARGKKTIIIDGPPGIGCPVISALSGASEALVVTEPTLSAIHDMERVLAVLGHFQVPAMVVINRFDLDEKNTRAIEEWCAGNGTEVAVKIPDDPAVTAAMVRGVTVVEHSNGEVSRRIRALWKRLSRAGYEAAG